MFNANNYGYNPYGRYIPQQPMQQPIQQMQTTAELQRTMLNGKQVESIDVVKSMDIPIDGSISYFPIADGSAIVTKQIQMNGISKTIVYKPVENVDGEKTQYITVEQLNDAVNGIDLSDIDDLKEDIKELKKEIKELKKKKSD